jgi:hypothetical protein
MIKTLGEMVLPGKLYWLSLLGKNYRSMQSSLGLTFSKIIAYLN